MIAMDDVNIVTIISRVYRTYILYPIDKHINSILKKTHFYFLVTDVEEVGRDKIHYGYFFVRFWLCEVLCKLFLYPNGHPIFNLALTHAYTKTCTYRYIHFVSISFGVNKPSKTSLFSCFCISIF